MLERFNDGARRVIVLAQEEARKLNHHFIGAQHVLLGLLREGHGVAARALTDLNLFPVCGQIPLCGVRILLSQRG